jgi:hypothetical protein
VLQAALEDALADMPRMGQRLWTSDQRYCGEGVPRAHQLELCSLLNAALRDDEAAPLEAAMPLIRAINSLCVVRGARPDALLRFPPADCCFRGGGLPDAHRGFFVPGRKYRVAGFLATSFDRQAPPTHTPRTRTRTRTPRPAQAAVRAFGRAGVEAATDANGVGGVQVADRFMYHAFEKDGHSSVLWVVLLDPRGASSVVHRCKQARILAIFPCPARGGRVRKGGTQERPVGGGQGGGGLKPHPSHPRPAPAAPRAVRGRCAAGDSRGGGWGGGQVNYVESSKFGDAEAEFLFAPYSAFTVVSVEASPRNSYLAPHVITLQAAVDNRLEPEDLPLAPWF